MILDEIVANKRTEIHHRQQRISLAEFRTRAESLPAPRNFGDALVGENVRVIAEIKRASPSRGELNGQADPPRLAQAYTAGGASAISVLTDKKYFRGSLNDLKSVRVAVQAPILRKDFIIDEYQVYESRALQVDAILLIVRVLADAQLRDYLALARSLGMSALVEIHNEADLERAMTANAQLIGINNRNLADFTVNLATTERLAPGIARDKVIVAESGVFTRADVERVARAGARAVLVGEALMRAADVGAKVQELANVKFGG
jgi:indole-3-glycerol phosphate synthase